MNVLKEGLLYLHGVKFGKKTWRKIWMIILKPEILEIGRLEIYSLPDDVTADTLPPEQDKTKRRVVLLTDCLGIALAPEEACPPGCTAFYLDTTLRTYTLASEGCQDWLLALCQLTLQDPAQEASEPEHDLLMKNCDLYSGLGVQPEQYHVTVVDTVASQRCLLAGEFTFLLDMEAAFLLDKDTARIIYRWPYIFMCRFGIIKGGFCVEAGHQCDSGEGVFSFLSPRGRQVCQAIARKCSIRQEAVDSSGRDLNKGSPNGPPSLGSESSPATPGPTGHHYAEVDHSLPSACRHPAPRGGPAVGGYSLVHHAADAGYSLIGSPGPDAAANAAASSLYEAVPFASCRSTLAPPPAVPAKPLRRCRPRSKGTRKTKAAGGPVDRSPSGPQNGAPLSFQQKLSKVISIDLARLQLPPRFGRGKS